MPPKPIREDVLQVTLRLWQYGLGRVTARARNGKLLQFTKVSEARSYAEHHNYSSIHVTPTGDGTMTKKTKSLSGKATKEELGKYEEYKKLMERVKASAVTLQHWLKRYRTRQRQLQK